MKTDRGAFGCRSTRCCGWRPVCVTVESCAMKEMRGVLAGERHTIQEGRGGKSFRRVLARPLPVKTPSDDVRVPRLRPSPHHHHPPHAAMEHRKGTVCFLTLAVIMDVLGLILFLVGIFAPLSFWDFFVLSGPLIIFLSLIFWIFWYMGNITVSEEELDLKKHDIL